MIVQEMQQSPLRRKLDHFPEMPQNCSKFPDQIRMRKKTGLMLLIWSTLFVLERKDGSCEVPVATPSLPRRRCCKDDPGNDDEAFEICPFDEKAYLHDRLLPFNPSQKVVTLNNNLPR